MLENQTEIIESFSTEGAISVSQAVLLFLILGVASAWLLWRERDATGTFWSSTFWLLRTVALALVLWMLLGPTNLIRQRTTIPQTVALLVDGSESMNVVDPLPPEELMRWSAVASDPHRRPDMLVACDRAAVALRVALAESQLASTAISRHQALRHVRQHLEAVEQATARAAKHLADAAGSLQRYDSRYAGRSARVLDALEGPVHRALAELLDTVEARDMSATNRVVNLLDTVVGKLSSSERRLAALNRELAKRIAAHPPSQTNPQQAASQSRREMVTHALNRLEEDQLQEIAKQVRIKRLRVDGLVTPVSADEGWEDALAPERTKSAFATVEDDQPLVYGPMTNLSAALEQLNRDAAGESIRAAILWSDGGHNAPGSLEPSEVAAQLSDLAVHVVPIGSSEPLRDVLLHRLEAPTAVILKDSIVIEAIITAFQCRGESTEVILRRDGKVVEQQSLEFSGDRIDHRLRFNQPAEELGSVEFELAIEPLRDEASDTNNVALAQIDIVRDSARVLLADRLARWEYRYLEQLFRRDDRVNYDRMLFAPRLTATGALESTRALPGHIDGWGRYDVVILGDMDPQQLNSQSQRALDEYVRERGGNLIVIAGRDHMPHDFVGQPLIDLLPVQRRGGSNTSEDGFTLTLTAAGIDNDAVQIEDSKLDSERAWRQQFGKLPLYFLSDFCRPKPGAETLVEAIPRERIARGIISDPDQVDRAFVCWHRVGAGRVAYIAAPATYQLRFRRGDRLHHRFWGQLLRWVTAEDRGAGTERVRIICDKTRYELGDQTSVIVRLADDEGTPITGAEVGAVATAKEGGAVGIELEEDEKVPGRYVGRFNQLEPGAYRIQPTGDVVERLLSQSEETDHASALITVFAAQNIELLDTKGNRALLEQVAEVTGGQVVHPTAIDEVLTLTALSPEVSEQIEREPLWNRWTYLWIIVGCLSTEWVVRKRLGLV